MDEHGKLKVKKGRAGPLKCQPTKIALKETGHKVKTAVENKEEAGLAATQVNQKEL